MKRPLTLSLAVSLLSACGGGGGGGAGSGAVPAASAPAAPAVAAIDINAAFAKFIGTDRSASLAANDGYLSTANLIVRTDESYPFITNGQAQAVAKTRVIQLQHLDSAGRLSRQSLWKFHLDASSLPVGLAFGRDNGGFKECMSVSSRNALPASSNASGVFFSGFSAANYAENFRTGGYAHYCDPASASASVEWSVQAGTPHPYFCLSLPNGFSGAKMRICAPVDAAGNLGGSLWVRSLGSDGAVFVDYKDTSANRPLEQFGTAIDPANYWYGAVWRPLDGYVYQRFEGTRFPSQQACREQTAIDWKKTWSASNIGWTCVNVKSS